MHRSGNGESSRHEGRGNDFRHVFRDGISRSCRVGLNARFTAFTIAEPVAATATTVATATRVTLAFAGRIGRHLNTRRTRRIGLRRHVDRRRIERRIKRRIERRREAGQLGRFHRPVVGVMLGVGRILRRVTHVTFRRRAIEPIASTATTATASTMFVALTIAFFTTRFRRRGRTRRRSRGDAAIGRVDFELAALELRDLE